MDEVDFKVPLKEAVEGIKGYVGQQLRFHKMLLAKHTGDLSAYFVLFAILLFIGAFTCLFLSFAFVGWYSDRYSSPFAGYLILAGFYLLLSILLFVFRDRFIFNPLRKLITGIFFSGDNYFDLGNKEGFSSKEDLDHQIQWVKEDLIKREASLKATIDKLGLDYSLSSMASRFIKNTYKTLMTTKNVARLSFFLVQKLMAMGGKPKKKKAAKNIKKNKEELNDSDKEEPKLD